jgi:molybdenum cofactor cytidylyltransferase
MIGVLLAAGRGSRMGGTKQLLPWPPDGSTPLVAAAFDAIVGVCTRMIVVVGHEADAVRSALAPRSFVDVQSDPDADMIESVRAGLRAAADDTVPVLLHPGDHPEVAPATLETILAAHRREPECVIMPEHEGRGGHPVLIPFVHIPAILTDDGPGGLREHWRRHPDLCRRVPVDDAGVIHAVNRPEDYAVRHADRPPRP